MIEAEWLTATEPAPMLDFLRNKASERKRRLLAVAAGWKIWEHLTDQGSRQAVKVAELFSDNLTTDDARRQAEENARVVAVESERHWQDEEIEVAAAGIRYWAAAAAHKVVSLSMQAVEEAISEAGMALAWHEDNELAAGPDHWAGFEITGPWPRLIRDIFGNPFHPVPVDPSWLASTVVALAEGIYTERTFERLPILADALEDAGCDSDDILNHLRSEGPHVRGCWVIDLLTGRK